MVTAKTIRVTPETELPDLLDEAATGPIVLERDGERFELHRVEESEAEPDPGPKTVAESLERYAGFITPEEAERWVEDIYRWREEGSRPPHLP